MRVLIPCLALVCATAATAAAAAASEPAAAPAADPATEPAAEPAPKATPTPTPVEPSPEVKPTAGDTAPAPQPAAAPADADADQGAESQDAPAAPRAPWFQIDSRGELGFESRAFWPDDAAATDDWNATMVGRLHLDAAAGPVTGKARVFSRLDPRDQDRSAFIPEELWLEVKLSRLRLRAGYQMINWTATEAFHPADVINSRYLDSAIENPEKLGEPMVSLRSEIPHGSVEAMFMPVFVEPIFPSARSRQRFLPPGAALGAPLVFGRDGEAIDDHSPYRFAPQGAVRVQQTWGRADVSVHGLAHIDRSYPLVVFDAAANLPRPVFLPVLQAGATYQQAMGAWLFKLELAYRWYRLPDAGGDPTLPPPPLPNRDHFVGAAGVEYGLPHDNGSESTLLLEGQLFVPRDADLPRVAEPLFQHDVLAGVRHAFNDEASRTVMVVVIVDALRPQELFANAGYAQRLGETWTVQAGVRFVRVPPRDPAAPLVFEWLNNSHQIYANLFRHF
jgi:hypothetical protein